MTKHKPTLDESEFYIWAATGRLAVALRMLPHYRLWNAAHVDNRRASGGGVFLLDEQTYAEWSKLSGLGRERIRVLVSKGRGWWWQADTQRSGHYFLAGQEVIAGRMAVYAAEKDIADPFERPQRYALPIDVLSGDLAGAIYTAWTSSRQGVKHGQQARWEDLIPLWNLSRSHMLRLMGVAT